MNDLAQQISEGSVGMDALALWDDQFFDLTMIDRDSDIVPPSSSDTSSEISSISSDPLPMASLYISDEEHYHSDADSEWFLSQSQFRSDAIPQLLCFGLILMIFGLCLISYLVISYSQFTTPKLPNDAAFSASLRHLKQWSSHARSLGTKHSDWVRADLISFLEEIQNNSLPAWDIEISTVYQEALQSTLFANCSLFCKDSSSIIVRVTPKHCVTPCDLARLAFVAHYDGTLFSKAVNDNGVPLAGLLTALQRTTQSFPDVPGAYAFVFTDMEEDGLCGAMAVANTSFWRNEVASFVNFDSIGSGGRLALIRSTGDAYSLVRMLEGVRVRAGGTFPTLERLGLLMGASDFMILDTGIAGMDLSFVGNPQIYHTPLDNWKRLKPQAIDAVSKVVEVLVSRWSFKDTPSKIAPYLNEGFTFIKTISFVSPRILGFFRYCVIFVLSLQFTTSVRCNGVFDTVIFLAAGNVVIPLITSFPILLTGLLFFCFTPLFYISFPVPTFVLLFLAGIYGFAISLKCFMFIARGCFSHNLRHFPPGLLLIFPIFVVFAMRSAGYCMLFMLFFALFGAVTRLRVFFMIAPLFFGFSMLVIGDIFTAVLSVRAMFEKNHDLEVAILFAIVFCIVASFLVFPLLSRDYSELVSVLAWLGGVLLFIGIALFAFFAWHTDPSGHFSKRQQFGVLTENAPKNLIISYTDSPVKYSNDTVITESVDFLSYPPAVGSKVLERAFPNGSLCSTIVLAGEWTHGLCLLRNSSLSSSLFADLVTQYSFLEDSIEFNVSIETRSSVRLLLRICSSHNLLESHVNGVNLSLSAVNNCSLLSFAYKKPFLLDLSFHYPLEAEYVKVSHFSSLSFDFVDNYFADLISQSPYLPFSTMRAPQGFSRSGEQLIRLTSS